jgi:hypothetical protein
MHGNHVQSLLSVRICFPGVAPIHDGRDFCFFRFPIASYKHNSKCSSVIANPVLDLRDPSTTPLNFTKSINLALSERGINAMRQSGRTELLESVMKEAIPMRGRMIHGESTTGELYEQSQDYDVHGRV